MTQEIKSRLDQIRRGEIPEGYKRTKAGIIPDEWKETRLKTMFVRLLKKNNDGNTNVLTISAQHGLISQETFFNKSIASEDKSNYYLLHRGDFAYNKSYSNGYPFGAIKPLTLYDSGIVSPLYICFSPTRENSCPEFYAHYFEGSFMNHEINAFAQEGARNHGLLNISSQDFFNSIIIAPPLPEQQKISEILSTQDKVIALYDKKIEQLQLLKKACLQKMFPKRGSKVPQIRFPGFTDDWEQRKLSEISDKVSKKNQDMVVDEVFTNSAEYGIISQRDYFDKDIANSENIDGYYIVEPNDFVYNPRISTLAPFGPIRRNKLEKLGAMSPLYYVFRTHDVDYGFLEYYFKTNGWHSFMHLNGNSGARSDRFAIRDEIFKEMPITMPQDIDEQKRIGDFFTTLEMAVTLHQRKRDEEKQKKKALMQLLLSGIVRVND